MPQTITPYLLYEDADAAVAFLTKAFGFREVDRTVGRGGGVHVEMEISPGGARIYLGSPGGDYRGPAKVGRTSLQYVVVDDVDAHHARAVAAGATITEELVDLPYGDRRYGCRDPQGHEWTFATPIARLRR
jgi:MerR family transcriptional regulator, thiopeptide resistance regulator